MSHQVKCTLATVIFLLCLVLGAEAAFESSSEVVSDSSSGSVYNDGYANDNIDGYNDEVNRPSYPMNPDNRYEVVQVQACDNTCNYGNCNGCGNIITDTGCVISESIQDVSIGVGNAVTNVGCAVGSIFN